MERVEQLYHNPLGEKMAIISLGEELANRIFCELYKGKNVGDFSDGCFFSSQSRI